MGESIAEGTVSKWLKAVGQPVERDEPILEISTDKVDAEIPAPATGTLVAIEVQEGQTVEVGTIVAYIDTEAAPSSNGGAPPKDAPQPAAAPQAKTEAAPAPPAAAPPPPTAAPQQPTPRTPPPPASSPDEGDEPVATSSVVVESAEERLRMRSTPVVRKIAEEHGVDLARVEGTGHAGRVTKQDILAYIESGRPAAPAQATPAAKAPAAPAPQPTPPTKPAAAPGPALPASEFWKTFYAQVQHPEFPVREGDRVEPMDKIRRLTAEHMVLAKRIAPHVHSFIEVDFTAVDRVRRENKKKWEEQGTKVSYTAFVAWAVARLLREFPQLNGTISGNNIIYRGNVSVGIAVDLNPGLIVPVLRDTDHMSLLGVGAKMNDLAERARARQLAPDEIQGATFTITNPGVLGTVVGLPVIPKGTSAILGTGAIEKRVVVLEDPDTGTDLMAIRKRALFSLGYDHRLVDGADSARFLSRLKQVLEDFPADA
jgi:2-oxoglutarate dehydrogenase E2 component (dihydrolipoamide succinyltransferase)